MMLLQPNISRRVSAAGVTMVEIALVILVIATLLGAVAGFKEITRVARLRKIATEAQSFGIAARTFEQKYDALPGDFDDAGTRLPGCQVTGVSASNPYGVPANPNFCRNGDGNGRIGRFCFFTWPECGQTGSSIPASDPDGNAINPLEPQETTQFWKHLYLAGLITGIIDPRADPNAQPRWQVSQPESAVWDAGYVISGQSAFIGGSVVVNFVPFPEFINITTASPNNAGNNRTLTVLDARYLDEKYDDNNPGGGAMWWTPVTSNGTGCRQDDGALQNTWEQVNVNNRNCTFSWTVF